MSYKTRQQKRQRRRHQKQTRAANANIDRFLRSRTGPGAGYVEWQRRTGAWLREAAEEGGEGRD